MSSYLSLSSAEAHVNGRRGLGGMGWRLAYKHTCTTLSTITHTAPVLEGGSKSQIAFYTVLPLSLSSWLWCSPFSCYAVTLSFIPPSAVFISLIEFSYKYNLRGKNWSLLFTVVAKIRKCDFCFTCSSRRNAANSDWLTTNCRWINFRWCTDYLVNPWTVQMQNHSCWQCDQVTYGDMYSAKWQIKTLHAWNHYFIYYSVVSQTSIDIWMEKNIQNNIGYNQRCVYTAVSAGYQSVLSFPHRQKTYQMIRGPSVYSLYSPPPSIHDCCGP